VLLITEGSTMAARTFRFCFSAILLALAGISLAGCSLPQKDESSPSSGNVVTQWLTGETPKAAEAETQNQPPGPNYTVEIRRPGYSTQYVRVPHQGETHLQDALEQSGAARKLKRMELHVMRTPPQGGPRQRLSADFDSGEKRVAWESDYAIYPGDHVVVIEDTSSQFDDMISRFMGPFGSK
jgi:hypothetical protein